MIGRSHGWGEQHGETMLIYSRDFLTVRWCLEKVSQRKWFAFANSHTVLLVLVLRYPAEDEPDFIPGTVFLKAVFARLYSSYRLSIAGGLVALLTFDLRGTTLRIQYSYCTVRRMFIGSMFVVHTHTRLKVSTCAMYPKGLLNFNSFFRYQYDSWCGVT